MDSRYKIKIYSIWSDTSCILNCVLSYDRNIGDVSIVVEQKKVQVKSRAISKVFLFPDLVLQPDTCRGLTCLASGEVHFSVKAEQSNQGEHVSGDVSHVTSRQIELSQNDLVERIQLLQNKWFCATCHQKLLTDRCILSRVLPLPSENWSDYADMWFCHKPVGSEPIKKQRFLPKPGECFVGETYLLIDGSHVQTGTLKVAKDGSLTCLRCGKQLGVVMEGDRSSHGAVHKFFIHTVTIQNIDNDNRIEQVPLDRGKSESFFLRLLLEQSQLYTSFRFIVETSTVNGYTNVGKPNTASTCLVWLLDTSVTVYKSKDDKESETILQKDQIIKILFKCQLHSSNKESSSVDYVTQSLISMWRKDNTVHGFTLPQPVFLQLIHILIQNCKQLCSSQRYLNGFHVSYLTRDSSTVS